MSSGVFRGKESSNRIELSQLVQDLLNFGVFGSLQLLGGSRWVGGCLGASGGMRDAPTYMQMHMHAHTHTHAHLYMYRNCKWPPTWRHPCLSCLSYLTCMCMHACACVCVHIHPHTPPPQALPKSTHPPPPQGGIPGISKNSITVELIKIIQFCLKI